VSVFAELSCSSPPSDFLTSFSTSIAGENLEQEKGVDAATHIRRLADPAYEKGSISATLLVVDEEQLDNHLTGNEEAFPFSNQNSSSKELMSCRARTVRSFKDWTFAGC